MSFESFDLEQAKRNALSIFNNVKKIVTNSKLTQSALILSSLFIGRKVIQYSYKKYYSLPPGPSGYPLFGCLFDIIRDKKFLVKCAIQYGNIFMFPFIHGNMIFISDAAIMKKLFVQKRFLNRKYEPEKRKKMKWKNLWTVGPENTAFLLSVNGEEWQKRRKHAQTALFRTMTNTHVGNVLQTCLNNALVPYLDEIIRKNELWYPRKICQYLAFNTLYETMLGKTISMSSDLYQQMIKDADDSFRYILRNNLLHVFKFLRWIKPFAAPVTACRTRRNATVAKLIRERVNAKDKKQETFIDLTHKLVENGEMTEYEVIADTMILFIAGTDTTSSTLEFGMVLAAKNVDIQNKVREELLEKMSDGFNLKLVHNCPLFRALVFEMIRVASVAYMGVQHIAVEKDYFVKMENGKRIRIPANTTIMTNMDYIHIYNTKDKNWKHIGDDTLCLENFLDDDGNFKMNDSFVAFGVGRRDCVGRQLALKELQYILGYVLMNYKLSLDSKVNILEHREPNLGTVFMKPKIGVKVEKL